MNKNREKERGIVYDGQKCACAWLCECDDDGDENAVESVYNMIMREGSCRK